MWLQTRIIQLKKNNPKSPRTTRSTNYEASCMFFLVPAASAMQQQRKWRREWVFQLVITRLFSPARLRCACRLLQTHLYSPFPEFLVTPVEAAARATRSPKRCSGTTESLHCLAFGEATACCFWHRHQSAFPILASRWHTRNCCGLPLLCQYEGSGGMWGWLDCCCDSLCSPRVNAHFISCRCRSCDATSAYVCLSFLEPLGQSPRSR